MKCTPKVRQSGIMSNRGCIFHARIFQGFALLKFEEQIDATSICSKTIVFTPTKQPKAVHHRKNRPFGRFFHGRGRRDRTLGTRFWRPMLYQLSYTPIYKMNIINTIRASGIVLTNSRCPLAVPEHALAWSAVRCSTAAPTLTHCFVHRRRS